MRSWPAIGALVVARTHARRAPPAVTTRCLGWPRTGDDSSGRPSAIVARLRRRSHRGEGLRRYRPYRAQLHELDTRGWSAAQIVDYRLIEAEMNGLDFDLRVRQPWARDPSFYATVFGERQATCHSTKVRPPHQRSICSAFNFPYRAQIAAA